ncbi:hypothetical protein F4777DRAFT_574632 [Nemania sp. FL0916]|nr:hypothetical protein F4777DRAFT_574632 [Nemania sp. FL0916]
MPLHLLGKKSWNVYNPANIGRVRRDEAEARARAEADEKQKQDREAERRLAILRGEEPPALSPAPPPASSTTRRNREHGEDSVVRSRDGAHKKRKRFGEDDTDFEMRVARDRANDAATRAVAAHARSDKMSNAPLVDARGHISLFPEDRKAKPQNDETATEEPSSRRRDESSDQQQQQYGMRFTDAAGRDGLRSTAPRPWYTADGACTSRENDNTPGKNVWGREDPKRRDRDAARVVAGDPLALMKRGAAKVRDVERERRTVNEERERELKQLRKEEKRQEKKRRRRDGDEDAGGLEGFRLDDVRGYREDEDEDRTRKKGREERERRRSRSKSRERSESDRGRDRDRDTRDKDRRHEHDRDERNRDRHHHGSKHNDHHGLHRHRKEHEHKDKSYRSQAKGDRDDGDRHSADQARRRLARTDHY